MLRKTYMSAFFVVLLTITFFPEKASANLCPPESVLPVHEAEAEELERERYSLSRGLRRLTGGILGGGGRTIQTQTLVDGCNPEIQDFPTPCYIGTRAYNARVIACNRERTERSVFGIGGQSIDTRQLDQRTAEERQFDNNLPSRVITGTLSYLGFAPKWFGYELERVDGTWIVTSTLDFEMPDEDRGFIRMNSDLAAMLSTSPSGDGGGSLFSVECNVEDPDVNDDIGMIDPNLSVCRMPADTELFLRAGDFEFLPPELGFSESRQAIDWLMLYYRYVIEKVWSRPGFQVKINIANFVGRESEITREELNRLKGSDAVYNVRLHNVDGREGGVYLPGPFQDSVYYTALDWGTMLHEFGHSLGLDDEYIQRREDRPDLEDFNCSLLNGFRIGNDPQGEIDDRQAYMMCNTLGQATSISTEDDNSERFGYHMASRSVKSVYPWIITQRYELGRELGSSCRSDDDCRNEEFCRKRPFRRNECVDKEEIGAECSRDNQCPEGTFCNGKPFGNCEGDNLLLLGSQCRRDAQCVSDKCERGECVCRHDHDCDAGNERCATPFNAPNRCMRVCNTNRDCEDLNLRCRRPAGARFRRCS